MVFRLTSGLCVAVAALPAVAQVRSPSVTSATGDQDDDEPIARQQPQTPIDTNRAGRTAQSAAGQVGQRQTRETAAAVAGIKPMARIANRIENRVQNRIRNRIDPNYDPQAGASDPFTVAEDRTRTGGRPR